MKLGPTRILYMCVCACMCVCVCACVSVCVCVVRRGVGTVRFISSKEWKQGGGKEGDQMGHYLHVEADAEPLGLSFPVDH